jgi:hypothetical protein
MLAFCFLKSSDSKRFMSWGNCALRDFPVLVLVLRSVETRMLLIIDLSLMRLKQLPVRR